MMISVVVTTYNWPDALRLVLLSLAGQSYRDFEIVIADDGSDEETRALVEEFGRRSPLRIKHVWQEDAGFRKAKILNAAVAVSESPYLVFLDGDCIAQPDFLARHLALSAPNHLVTGSRVLLRPQLTAELCAAGTWDYRAFRRKAPGYRWRGDISKIMSLFARLPCSPFRDYGEFTWRRVRGCNFACWKDDFLAVGGCNESMIGWGHEDVDLVFRMQRNGVTRRSGTWATEVLHLWHKQADRSHSEKNLQMVLATMEANRA